MGLRPVQTRSADYQTQSCWSRHSPYRCTCNAKSLSAAIAFDSRKLCLAVFDSHSHHGSGIKLGASIAVALLDDVGILYTAEFLDFVVNENGLANGTIKGADIILIQ